MDMLIDLGISPIEALIFVIFLLLVSTAIKRVIAPAPYRNIVGPRSQSFLYGHLREVFGASAVSFHDHLQDTYGSVTKLKGTFGSDQLYITDPRAMQEILVKEHDVSFRHPQFTYDFFAVVFGPGLATATGAMHKAQRKMLNPVFSAKHIKSRKSFGLVSSFHTTAQELRDVLVRDLGDQGSKDTDVLYWCNSTALELMGQAGLGHSFGLLRGVHSAYSVAIKEFLPIFAKLAPYRAIFSLVYHYVPSAALRRKIVEYTPIASIQIMKNIVDVQDEQARVVLKQKKEALKFEQDGSKSKDILSAVLKSNTESTEVDKLPDDQVLGQVNTLIFAGHETTSGALARVLHMLAQNPAVQSRLRTELDTASPTADYDEIQSLPFLDAVCREVLRLYPPAISLERRSIKDCVIPLRYPVKGNNGDWINEIKITKGTHIYLGLREANRCRETWGDDADEFRPERWLDELPQSVTDAKLPGVYSSMMTFGAGPRACIGFKFSVLELKIVLSTLLRSFEFSPSTTPVEWRFTGGMAPYLASSDLKEQEAQLPLRVTLIS